MYRVGNVRHLGEVNADALGGQRHFFRNSNPKRKRGNELGTIPRSRFGLQKRSVSAKIAAVQLGGIDH